jgi:predicted permease
MKNIGYFLKYAFRNVIRKPVLSGSIIASVGISIGALLCILTLCYLLIAQPLPYKNADQLYVVTNEFLDKSGEIKGEAYTYPGVLYLDEKQTAFTEAAMLYYSEDVVTSDPQQPVLNTTFVSHDWFTLLQVPMHLGRAFDVREKLATFTPSAIISYQAWRKQFNSDPEILNRKIDIGGRSYTVVGVTGKSFYEPQLRETGRNTDFWLPWDFNPSSKDKRESWSSITDSIFWVGRLKSEYTNAQAQQLLTPLIDTRWQQEVSGKDFFAGWKINAKLAPLKDFITGDSTKMAILLLIGVLGLALISCVNISCLMMSRAAEQQKSMAIQATVGARMRQLFAGKLAETGIMMVASMAVAFVIAVIGFGILQSHMSTLLPRVDELHLNSATLLSAVVLCIVLSLVFAYLSLGAINYKALAGIVQSGSKGGGLQLSKRKQQVLIATQVAIASFLIFCNIALFLNAKRIIDTDMGFKIDGVSRVTLDESHQSEMTYEQQAATLEQIKASLKTMPGVEKISQSGSPLSSFSEMALTDISNNESHTPMRKQVDQDYFGMISLPLIAGRNFTQEDIRNESKVMIIDEAFAKKLGGELLKARLSTGEGEPYQVVGVVKSITPPGEDAGIPRVYTPNYLDASFFILKTKTDINREAMVARIKESTSSFVVNEYAPLRDTLRIALFKQIATLAISAVLTLLIVVLSGLGIYGIINNSVQQRRFELGTRIAVGAKKNQLVQLIAKQNIVPILIGVAVQLVLLAGLYVYKKEIVAPYVNMALIGIFAANLAIVLGIALTACYLPMRALFSKSPAFILRNE